MSEKYTVWTRKKCPNCLKAKALLNSKGLDFEEKEIDNGYTVDDLYAVIPTAKEIPQILLGDKRIGNYRDLIAHLGDN